MKYGNMMKYVERSPSQNQEARSTVTRPTAELDHQAGNVPVTTIAVFFHPKPATACAAQSA